MPRIYTIDPGMSTGITLGHFDDSTPYTRDEFWQIEGGRDAFDAWMWGHVSLPQSGVKWVCEKFTPRPMQRSFKTDELEPIRIEGTLETWAYDPDPAWGFSIIWQRPDRMVLRKGDSTAESKRLSDNLLREKGLWLTGKSVGCKDANDVNAATKHALAYMRFINHQPSIEKYFT